MKYNLTPVFVGSFYFQDTIKVIQETQNKWRGTIRNVGWIQADKDIGDHGYNKEKDLGPVLRLYQNPRSRRHSTSRVRQKEIHPEQKIMSTSLSAFGEADRLIDKKRVKDEQGVLGFVHTSDQVLDVQIPSELQVVNASMQQFDFRIANIRKYDTIVSLG